MLCVFREVLWMNKKILVLTLLFVLFSVSFVSARVCNTDDVLDDLRKALYLYYVQAPEGIFTADELKDLLSFYVGIQAGQVTIDCTEQSDNIDRADALPDKIPSCSDGTKYGKCNLNNKPMYCYAGNLVPRCRLCGCPQGQWCDITYVDTSKGNKGQWGKCYPGKNVTCVVDSDCGTSGYIGNYTCIGMNVYRDYKKYECDYNTTNLTYTNSTCMNYTMSILIDDCNATEKCVSGQAECQIIPHCSDGTPYDQCSITNPKYCKDGTLIDNCQVCGCEVECGKVAKGGCECREMALPIAASFIGGMGGIEYDGTYVWLGDHFYDSYVYKVDPTNGKVLASYPAPNSRYRSHYYGPKYDPYHSHMENSVVGLAYDKSQNDLYHLLFPYGEIVRMDVSTWQEVPGSYFRASSYSHDITFDGTYVWVTRGDSLRSTQRVYKYDPSTGRILGSFTADINPSNVMGITWDGNSIWITEGGVLYKVDQNQAIIEGSVNDNVIKLRIIDVPGSRIAWENPYYNWENNGKTTVYKLDLSNCQI